MNDNPRQHIAQIRFLLFYAAMMLVGVVFIGRLIQLQVFQYEAFSSVAIENRQTLINIPAPRGVIYDRNGIILAENVPSYNVTITPAYLPDEDDQSVRREEIFRTLSQLLDVPIDTPPDDVGPTGVFGGPPTGIRQLVFLQDSNAPYQPVIIKRDVEPAIAFIIAENLRNMPGVGIDVAPLRNYPTNSLTAHLVGYMGPITREVQDFYIDLGFDPSRDRIGYAGIEAYFQNVLAGRNGSRLIERDVAGLELRTIGEPVLPVAGNNVVLTIDVRLQAAAEAALRRRLEIENAVAGEVVTQNGVAIAMNPTTGEILAMVSWPPYENQRFARLIPADYYQQLLEDPRRPLLNQAISGEHPPGSVFKIVVAAGALQEGVVTADQTIFDPGEIVIQNRYFPNDPGKSRRVVCWKRDGHGAVDFITGIAQSCNVYFYSIGGGYSAGGVDQGIDIEGIYKYATMHGYNELTGIELPGEADGLIPNRDWKRLNLGENWSSGDTYIAAVGQGFVLATPLQVLNSFTPYMNNGELIRPTLIAAITDGEGNVIQPFERRVIRQTGLTEFVMEFVRRGMRQVFIDGTGKDLNLVEGVTLAGKSGTAEYCDNVAQAANLCQFGAWPEHAWFVSYAPYEAPEIAVVVFIYNGGEGSLVAGPVAVEIVDAYFALKAVDDSRGTVPLPPEFEYLNDVQTGN